eukprot:TRINITY_DN515_c0_g1_i3.p1 TRINITY_DN515_c0_g1~~TRINITY_DN515_c0_g1_i3.p1  ORF type:complete len:200 (+),score=64.40 TRINITY_DN515_c0_g1_i3:63-662(+)
MTYELPPLPYAKNALAPHLSEETLNFHYEKHHRGYVNKLNQLAAEKPAWAGKSYEELIKTESGVVFNQAAQIWNHTFYWKSLSPNGGGAPTGKVAELINEAFGSFDAFKEKFSAAASGHFGSGWAWLVRDDNNKLQIVSTHDAGNPIKDGHIPVLTCDVWEHAYYIDFRNDRPKYIATWWNLVNWEFANSNLNQQRSFL